MTVELRKLMREVFLVGYTVGSGKESLDQKKRKNAEAEFERFFLALKNKNKNKK